MQKKQGFKVGIVTNSYWATSIEDAEIWLKAFSESSIDNFSISDDTFHYENEEENLSKNAKKAAENLKLPVLTICIDDPTVKIENGQVKGNPVIGGGAMFKGRAVEKLINGLPKRPWEELTECPHEDFKKLGRIHVDSFGNAHICQGLSIGNLWETPLSELIKNYDDESHPICGPLIRGGPAQLVKEYDIEHENKYVDECHLCFTTRLRLIDKFPKYLAPRQVFGIE